MRRRSEPLGHIEWIDVAPVHHEGVSEPSPALPAGEPSVFAPSNEFNVDGATIEFNVDGATIEPNVAEYNVDGATIEPKGNRLAKWSNDHRVQRLEVSTHAGSTNPGKPVAQILQATKSPPTEVLAFLNQGAVAGRFLRKLKIDRGSATVQLASGQLASGQLASEQLARSDTKASSKGGRHEVLLTATLFTVFPLLRKVAVRVYPSASQNLTIIDVLPLRSVPGSTKWFIAAGVAAVTELTDRIEAEASATNPE